MFYPSQFKNVNFEYGKNTKENADNHTGVFVLACKMSTVPNLMQSFELGLELNNT